MLTQDFLYTNSLGIKWLCYPLLEKKIPHATFLRHQGQSQGAFASLNLSFEVGDSSAHVKENRRGAFSIVSYEKIYEMEQVHGDHIALIDQQSPSITFKCDALITQTPGTALLIKHADCQAAILFDKKRHAIGAVHCGWKGSCQNIYSKTIKAMQYHFGTDPKDLTVSISPSIGPKKLELIHYQKELPKNLWKYKKNNFFFDFWQLSHHQLVLSGVLPESINNLKLCTASSPTDFFSYRRDQRITGRHATIAVLP